MKQSNMICSNCIYSKQVESTLRCIRSLPARWESITAYNDFPEVTTALSCGQGNWWGEVKTEDEGIIPWLYSYGEHDEPESSDNEQ